MKKLIMADVHSNLTALKSVLEDAELNPESPIVCLGDLVGYGARPNESIDLLRERDAKIIAGNHDAAACGRMGTDYFNRLAAESARWTNNQLSDSNYQYLRDLPETVSDDDFRYYHGSPDGPLTEYVRNERIAAGALDAIAESKLAVGHTHQPILYRFRQGTIHGEPVRGNESIHGIGSNEQLVMNPGSVGQPRDGDPRASYVILEEHGNGAVDLNWNRVEYDIQTAQERIRSAGLPEALASRLSRGK